VACRIASHLPGLRHRIGRRIMYATFRPGGRLLDYGCGNGGFLAFMRGLGWAVAGYEPDADAAAAARDRYLLEIRGPDGPAFPDGSFGAITMSHVIEHVPDPIATLRDCARLLEADGQLTIVTPNAASLGHRLTGASWRGLEVPRHLHLFSPATLAECVRRAGLAVERAFSSAVSTGIVWARSRVIQTTGQLASSDPADVPRRFAREGDAIAAIEALVAPLAERGEESVVIARKL
jgi:SAM-dependent methyltransferase